MPRQFAIAIALMLWNPLARASQPTSQPTTQAVPYFDLSEGWMLTEEATEAAQVSQNVRLPFPGEQPVGRYTLERTVELPPGVDSRELGLLLPRLHGAHRVQVNGRTIGAYGDMASWNTPLPLPRAYSLAALNPARQLRIAIEISRPRKFTFTLFAPPGPNFPLLAPERIVETELHARMVTAAFSRVFMAFASVSSLLMGLILLLFAQRSQAQTALGVLAGGIFLSAFQIFLSLSGTVLAWPAAGIDSLSFSTAIGLTGAANLEFGFRYAGYLPKWRWLFYLSAFGAVFFGPPRTAVEALIVGVAALCLYRGWRRGVSSRLVLAALVVFEIVSVQPLFPSRYWGGIYVPPGVMARPIIYAAIVILLIQRAAADRTERLRLAGELEAATTVQRLLLESLPCAPEGWRVEPVYMPAQEVGGDFFQITPQPDGGLLVIVGDVSGKGLKAAMTVSLVIGALRREASSIPREILEGLNRVLTLAAGPGFVTCCCARIAGDGRVAFANAGHIAPWRQGGEVAVDGNLPLGITPDLTVTEQTFALGSDEQLTFVSDGVVEAADNQGELFGFERTQALSMQSAREIAESAKAWGQNDDITVVTVRRATVRRAAA